MTWCPDAPEFVVAPEQWGAAYADRYDPAGGRQVITPARKLIVHHTASNAPDPGDEADFTRQLEAYGESRDGAAVEYSYLIYPSGVIHGGFGDTRGCHAAQLDPAAGVNYNETAIGVAFVGYFHPPNNDQPTPAAVATFQAWLEWMVDSGRLSTEVLEPAAGPGAAGWYGHRDVWATACPGDVLYPQLPELVRLPEGDDTMTDADWARMQTLVHQTVLELVRSPEFRQIVTDSDYAVVRSEEYFAIVQREAFEADLAVVRSEEFAAILATNTGP